MHNQNNGGYATGYNVALRQIQADYYILLNSDIEVTANWIKPIIEFMDSDSVIGACQPKIRSYSEKEKFEYAGASGGFIDKYGYPFCRGRIFQSLEVDKGQYNDSTEVFWATGACMFIRSDVFHELGGFDDDFFAHMEEIDLCWRMKSIGKKVMVCPSSMVYHVGGGTLPVGSARKTYLNFRNNFVLLYKNLPTNMLFSVLVLRLFLDGMAGIKFLLQGGFSDFLAVIRAHFYFYGNWSHIHKKRKKTIRNKVSKVYNGNIAIDHYFYKKKNFSDLKKPFS
ncbi:MAG: glycosyltransferase family 2 protein [Bacteroidetes bacterium]|nr:MAG: glycosyltransferase family 2 protein [Bacteroidota bacterium]